MKQIKKDIITIPDEIIINKILLIRSKKVMIDRDLAELYEVETKVLNQAVKINIRRFPLDFMFQLNKNEFKNLRSQFVTSSWGGRRQEPFVFTEQGIAMLSSVLRSDRAINVNIQIIRTFIKIRELLSTNKELKEKVDSMEKKYDKELKVIFNVLNRLLIEEKKPKDKIGF